MTKHQKVAELVRQVYTSSTHELAGWMWQNHLQLVARQTEKLAERFGAEADIAVAGAWLHDFGDAFVDRHSVEHETISKDRGLAVLQQADYTDAEIRRVMDEVIAPHSCQAGFLPTTLEGKVMATADALAHLTSDFYVQFAWKHLPQGKNYQEYLAWVREKLERDFNVKIFFAEVKDEVRTRYEALKEVFVAE